MLQDKEKELPRSTRKPFAEFWQLSTHCQASPEDIIQENLAQRVRELETLSVKQRIDRGEYSGFFSPTILFNYPDTSTIVIVLSTFLSASNNIQSFFVLLFHPMAYGLKPPPPPPM